MSSWGCLLLVTAMVMEMVMMTAMVMMMMMMMLWREVVVRIQVAV